MSKIALAMNKATGFGGLPKLVESRASPATLSRIFEQTGLPLEIVETPKVWIPHQAMTEAFERAARAVGDRGFGLQVGFDMGHRAYGRWLEYCAQAANLREGLQRSIATNMFQQSGGGLALREQAHSAHWLYIAPGRQLQTRQHVDHLIGPMIFFARVFLGRHWWPKSICLAYPRDRSARQIEARLPCLVRFGQGMSGIEICCADLERPSRAVPHPAVPPYLTLADVIAEDPSIDPCSDLQTVLRVILLRLLQGESDLDGAAKTLSIGTQGLQRLLHQGGSSYRVLLNRARRLRAEALLREGDLPITDIALSLGYSDHANFTRAFRRMTGQSPKRFRQSNKASS